MFSSLIKKYKRGFTLIELLVVIAIIGILSAIILVSLGSAKKRGVDARIISEVRQMNTLVQADYQVSTDSYPDIYVGGTSVAYTAYTSFLCQSVPSYNNLLSIDADISRLGGQVIYTAMYDDHFVAGNNYTGIDCGGGWNNHKYSHQYAIYGKLVSDPTKYYCIDSTGKSNLSAVTTTGYICP